MDAVADGHGLPQEHTGDLEQDIRVDACTWPRWLGGVLLNLIDGCGLYGHGIALPYVGGCYDTLWTWAQSWAWERLPGDCAPSSAPPHCAWPGVPDPCWPDVAEWLATR